MDQALRKPISQNPKTKTEVPSSKKVSPLIFIGFALICFITALVMNSNSSKSLNKSIPVSGGEIGPFTVEKDKTVVELKARQPLEYGHSSYVSGDVLDQNKNHLFSFGKEFWAETGYDMDGHWSESDTSMKSKFTLQQAGTYYIRLTSEHSQQNCSDIDLACQDRAKKVNANISVSVSQKRGSSLPHLIAGIFGLLIAVVLYFFENLSSLETSSNWDKKPDILDGGGFDWH